MIETESDPDHLTHYVSSAGAKVAISSLVPPHARAIAAKLEREGRFPLKIEALRKHADEAEAKFLAENPDYVKKADRK